jgi:hypothetical protein
MSDAVNRYARCRWPNLPEQANRALRMAVRYILERFDPDGIVATGSIVRGNPGPTSDLDIHVIHVIPERQRIQKRFEGVPTEIFVNPPVAIRRYFADEVRQPCTAHMLTTGFVVLDDSPVVAQLVSEAQDWLARPLELTATEVTSQRYLAADAFDNARDIQDTDSAAAIRILNSVVDNMLDYAFLVRGRTLPRVKTYLKELDRLDADLGEVARQYYVAHDVAERFFLADEIARRTIGESSFFEWESPPETIGPE